MARFLTVTYFLGLTVATVVRLQATFAYRRGRPGSGREYLRRAPLDALLISLTSVGMFLAPAAYAFTGWLRFADYRLPPVAGPTGVLLFALAILLLWRSHFDLGRNWSPGAEPTKGRQLVTVGVFRHIRHPMYVAHLLWALAQPLLIWNWVAGFSLLITFLPAMLYRLPREERMLAEQFGDEYRVYAARTGALLPRAGR